jgi:hypothetical protein
MPDKKPKRARLAGRNTPLSPRRLSVADKRRKALELRKAGASFDSIAQELGFANKGGAYKAVMAALDSTVREPANEVRKLELERLDRLFLVVWPRALAGDTKALDRCLQIMRQRGSLEGLNIDKLALTDPTGEKEFSGGLTDEERAERLVAILEQARTRRDRQAAAEGVSAAVDTTAWSADAGLSHASG